MRERDESESEKDERERSSRWGESEWKPKLCVV